MGNDGSEEIYTKRGRFGLRAAVYYSWDFPEVDYVWYVWSGGPDAWEHDFLAEGSIHVTSRANSDYGWDDYTDERKGSRAMAQARAALMKLEAREAKDRTTTAGQSRVAQERKLKARRAGLLSAAKRQRQKAGLLEQTAHGVGSAIDLLFARPTRRRR